MNYIVHFIQAVQAQRLARAGAPVPVMITATDRDGVPEVRLRFYSIEQAKEFAATVARYFDQ